MKEEGKLVIGPNTETVKMMGFSILVRTVTVPVKKSNLIIPEGTIIHDGKSILDMYKGFNPFMVEVIAVSKKAEEEGLSRGDICIPTKTFIQALTDPELANSPRNPYTTEIHDNEFFVRATVGDIEAVLPYMRKYVLKGKVIVDKI